VLLLLLQYSGRYGSSEKAAIERSCSKTVIGVVCWPVI
jgi:hypothetical protein